MNGIIFNIQKFCLHDGDGIRTSVFLKGCPLRCEWCHNPESQRAAPELMYHQNKCTACGKCVGICPARGKIIPDRSKCVACGDCVDICPNRANELCGITVTTEEVMAEVRKDKIFYQTSGGGMTVTGGEPSAQPEFTLSLIRSAKRENISAAVETCGYGRADFFRQAAELGAVFLYDIKVMDSDRHKALTGVSNAQILDNLRMLMDMGADITLRLPLIPGVNDTEGDISALVSFMKENDGRFRHAEIMPYHKMGVGKATAIGRTATVYEEGEKFIDKWLQTFEKLGYKVFLSN
ncbi:MAG: glycyl-radical enzyme activating protein [Eubacteriales bacterium]